MDATTETTSVERTLSIEARPETVWEFLVDPDKATRWMGQACTFEAQPGGLYRCEVIPGHTARGEFVEIDAPRRLVFTWGWENTEGTPPGSSTVEIELTAEGDGTSLHFVHTLSSAESAESHSHGWDHYLPRLEEAAAGRDPGEDPWVTNPPAM
ncbi:MAG: SRPBCC domain-containing protein [Actinobacteria bacterium]|nr:SRPBCC domain-containing protein [Actinomycetota bacterium]